MDRLTLIADTPTDTRAAFAADVREGLLSARKHLGCRWLYDDAGSDLFEQICDLPEYYLTRAETEILRDRAEGIAAGFGPAVTCVELGSGSATKTRLLINAFLASERRLVYAPVDISPVAIESSARALLDAHAALEVVGVVGDYGRGMQWMQQEREREKLVIWLGSSVGNFDRQGAAEFLLGINGCLTTRDRLLIGIDLRKDGTVLERAYDDEQGVTARFITNVLTRINRELGGNFDIPAFRYEARYEDGPGRIVINLVSQRRQEVRIEDLDLVIPLEDGEPIHVEDSYKYSPDEIDSLAAASRFEIEGRWLDSGSRFSLSLFAPK